jgi:hypothetical protein
VGGLGAAACSGGERRESAQVGPKRAGADAWARTCAEKYLIAPASRGRRDVCMLLLYTGLDDPSKDSCVRLVRGHVPGAPHRISYSAILIQYIYHPCRVLD